MMNVKLLALFFALLLTNLPLATALEINENSIQVTELDSDSAKISWTTDIESYGYVDYGISSNNMQTIPETGGTTSYHSIVLDDLYPGEKYYYKVRAEDGYSDVDESSFFEFTTLLSPPENLVVDSVTDNSADVQWDTVSSSQKYRLFLNGELYEDTTTSSMTIEGLDPESTYSAYVRAVDSDERMSASSNTVEFTTTEEPYNITFVELTGVTNTSATVSWKTSRAVKGEVKYDTDMGLASTKKEDSAKKEHTITLSGLTPDRKYYYKIISGNDETDVMTFKTRESGSPSEVIQITDVNVESVQKDSATITWKTNIPSQGEVRYGTDENLDSTKEETQERTEHGVTISNLLSTTKYYFKVYAKGASTSFKNFNTQASSKNFLSVDDLPELVNKPVINVTGKTAVNGRVYIFTNDNSNAQVRENIQGTKFRLPVKLSSMQNYKGKQGNNKITVMSWDVNGNKDTAEVFVRYDSSPPSLDIRNVPTLTGADTITIKGTSEKGATITFYLDNQMQTKIEKLDDKNFQKELNIGNGETVLKIVAQDSAGNKANYEKKITIDATAPEIKFNNTWKPTHFKLYRIWGKTEPGAKIKAINFGKYSDCREAALDLDYVSCKDFLEGEKASAQVDPISYGVGVERETTAEDDGEFSLIIPLVMSTEEGDGKETRNNIQINVTDKAGNTNEYSRSLIYRPGCSDWSIGRIQSFPFNIYTSDLNAGDIAGSSFFPVYYEGSGTPKVLEVAVGKDKADASGKVVNPETSVLETDSNEMVDLQMHNDNKYVSIGSPKASAYDPGQGAFNVYAPVTINQYRGAIKDLPEVMYAYLSVNIIYEGPNGKTSCEVYPKISFDVQKPENVAEWMSPEQINKTIEGLEEAINYTEQAVDIARDASNYGLLACGAMIAWQYVKGFAGVSDEGGEGCNQEQQEMKNVYYLCDRVLCPSAPPQCDQFNNLGDFKVDGDNVNKETYQKQLDTNMKCRRQFQEEQSQNPDADNFNTWRASAGGACNNYKQVTPPTFSNEIQDPNNPDTNMDIGVDYYEVRNGEVLNGPGQNAQVESDDKSVSVSIQLTQSELNNYAKEECGRTGSGTLIISRAASYTGEAGVFAGAEKEWSGPRPQCILGQSPEEVMTGGKTLDEYAQDTENTDEYGMPDETKIRGCYDESCPRFDGTKCPKWFSLMGDSSGGAEGYANINPPEGLWSSLKCVCLPGILKHLENYLKIMKGAKKCLEQARIGEVKGGFCERLMAQFACDLIIEALKYILSLDYSASGGADGGRGIVSNYKENSQRVSESLSDRYSGVAKQRLGLSSDQLVHKACVFAITQDWALLEGVFENYIDTVDVEPVASLLGESRPYGYDPFTGKMSIGYNIYVGLVPGGDTDIRLVLKCNPDAPGGDYCGPDAGTVDITSKLQRNHLTRDDAAINKNIRFQQPAVYWYNVVELQLNYYVGDEHKTKTITKNIWRKGDLAATCHFDVTKGIYCDSYTGFAGKDGMLEVSGFDTESRLTPLPPGPFVPGNNIAAFVKTRNQYTGEAFLWFRTDNGAIEYPIQGTGEKTAEGNQGIKYYNLWIDRVKETTTRVSVDGQRNILKDKTINLDSDGKMNFQVIGAQSITLSCKGDGFSGTVEVPHTSTETLEAGKDYVLDCFSTQEPEEAENYEVDEVRVEDVKMKKSDISDKRFEIKLQTKDGWESFEVDISSDDNEQRRLGTEDITMNVLEDTSGNGKGDSLILYDTRNQESKTSYQVTNAQTENPPAIDWLEPQKDTVPSADDIPLGFNIWTDNRELDELEIQIKGSGMKNRDVDCQVKINKENVESNVYMDNCDDVFQVKSGRLNYFGKDESMNPPFFEVYLVWKASAEEIHRDADAQYDITVTAKYEDGKETEKGPRRFHVYPATDIKTEDLQVILGGECNDCINFQEASETISEPSTNPPATK